MVALRLQAFGEVVRHLSEAERAALVRGTEAFTAAYRSLSDNAS